MHGSADGGNKKERKPEIRFFHRKNNETKTLRYDKNPFIQLMNLQYRGRKEKKKQRILTECMLVFDGKNKI